MKLAFIWQTTRSCFVNKIAIIMLVVYGFMIMIGLMSFWTLSLEKAADSVGALASIPALFWWAFVASRTLKILRDADHLLLPSPMTPIITSLAFQAIITIVIPSMVCGLLGGNFLETLFNLIALAACGLLFMLVPRYLSISMCLIPNFMTSLEKQGFIPQSNSNEYLFLISILTVILVSLVFSRFRQLRAFDGELSAWKSPMALLPDAVNGWNSTGWAKSDNGKMLNLGVSFEAAVEPASAVRQSLALRTFLGGAFMPLTMRGRLKQIFFLMFIYIGIPTLMVFTTTQDSNADRSMNAALAICWVIFVGLTMTLGSILFRLQLLYSKDNTELAELALLPGWKSGSQARSLLFKVIAQHAARALMLPLLMALVAAGFVQSGNYFVY